MEKLSLGLPTYYNDTFSCDIDIAKSLYSIAAPVIILMTFVCNSLYIILINYEKKERNASEFQCMCVAITNTLVGLCQLPVFIYFFNKDNVNKHVSIHWCYTYRIMGYVLPCMFHTASMWQLVIYGIQRFCCNRWPFSALHWYKLGRFYKYTVIVFVSSFLVHSCKLFDFTCDSGKAYLFRYRDSINSDMYVKFYRWFCAMFIQLIPCIIMTITCGLLVYTLRVSFVRRKNLFRENSNGSARNRIITMKSCQPLGILMLLLCVEWPITISQVGGLIRQDNSMIDCSGSSAIVPHFALLVSYVMYLPVYLFLNFKLRRNFVNIKYDIKVKLIQYATPLKFTIVERNER